MFGNLFDWHYVSNVFVFWASVAEFVFRKCLRTCVCVYGCAYGLSVGDFRRIRQMTGGCLMI